MAQAIKTKTVTVDGERVDLGGFAYRLGKADGAKGRLSVDISEPWHEAYKKADADTRKLQFRTWQVDYIRGRLGISASAAVKIVDGKKSERAEEEQKAWAAGSMAFLHHVKRNSSTGKKATKAKGKRAKRGTASAKASYTPVRTLTPAVRKAAMALCAEFDGEDLAEQARKAIGALVAIAK